MKLVNINNFKNRLIMYEEISKINESGIDFQLEIEPSFTRNQREALEIVNLLLQNREFIRNNNLISKQYTFVEYFNEIYSFFEFNLFSIRSEDLLILESEQIDGIYERALFFSKRD